MAKKERHQEVIFAPETEIFVPEEEKVLFEAEAYGSPQPDKGSDVTVTKPVGLGGPVPIVAPKHNTIQLQPIVVPLAVVPYMTQDSNVLRTDGKQQGAYAEDAFVEATIFEETDKKSKKKARKDVRPRVFSLITLLLALAAALPVVLSGEIDGFDRPYLSVIGAITAWVNGTPPENILATVCCLVGAAFAAFVALGALAGLIVGRYPRAYCFISGLLSPIAFLVLLVYELIKKTFVVGDNAAFIAVLVIALLNFVLTVVFASVLNHADDKKDRMRIESEI